MPGSSNRSSNRISQVHNNAALQAAIFVAQVLQRERVFQGDCCNPCDRAEEVNMIFFEFCPGACGQKVENADGSLDCNQRNAQHAFGVGGVGRGAAEDGRALPQSTLHQLAAKPQRSGVGRLPVPGTT